MFNCKCIHKDAKVVINSLIENEILSERKEKIIRQQTEKRIKRSELLEDSYIIVAGKEINQLKDVNMNKIPDC